MLHVKLWLHCVTTRTTKWSIPSIGTFRAEPVKESMIWCCPWKIVIMMDALLTK
jgi:hypothetical protein